MLKIVTLNFLTLFWFFFNLFFLAMITCMLFFRKSLLLLNLEMEKRLAVQRGTPGAVE